MRGSGAASAMWFLAALGIAACRVPNPPATALPIRAPADTTPVVPPVPVDSLVSFEAGIGRTCLTTSGGAGYCWGDLGPSPGKVYRILDRHGLAASFHTLSPSLWSLCGLTTTGEPWCDRRLASGPAGPPAMSADDPEACRYQLCLSPLLHRGQLPMRPLRALSRGLAHACAIGGDAGAYCLGNNHMGQLGTGAIAADPGGSMGEPVREPMAVAGGLRFGRISVGELLTCGITLGRGSLYCWGYAQSGEAGDRRAMAPCVDAPPHTTRSCSAAVPTRVLPESLPPQRTRPSEERFVSVSAGMRLACAVSTRQMAYCWGNNMRCVLGRCGTGDSERARLILVPGRVSEVRAGYLHACARTVDGRIFCWGNNTEGELGSLVSLNAGPDGLPPDYRDSARVAAGLDPYSDPCFLGGRCSPAPVEVEPGTRWSALAVGPRHACALKAADGAIYCWGGTAAMVLGEGARMVPCINRSTQWRDVLCQPTPVLIPGLPRLVVSAGYESTEVPSGRGPVTETVVEVSRRRVRIAFPADTSGSWGWAAMGGRTPTEAYSWSMSVDGMDGPASIALWVRSDSTARAFASLDEVIGENRPRVCSPGMLAQCTEIEVTAAVERDRLVMTVADSASIARLFGMRPASVRVFRSSPEEDPSYRNSVPVRYLDPQIPEPDSATRADAAASRRRYAAGITHITRQIIGPEQLASHSWIAIGDSVVLQVRELRCQYDACFGDWTVADSGWSAENEAILRLSSCSAGPQTRWVFPGSCVVTRGLRAGRTTIRVQGLHGSSDTAASTSPPARSLERVVVVGQPVARLAMAPRRAPIPVGDSVVFRSRALDRAGRRVAGVPIELSIEVGSYTLRQDGSSPRPIAFDQPGRRRVVASYRGLADTLWVTIVDRRNR